VGKRQAAAILRLRRRRKPPGNMRRKRVRDEKGQKPERETRLHPVGRDSVRVGAGARLGRFHL